jgi:3-hydroxymyristoyl/3-hydroxydecanoyl-(acyl carrier protein) dehydratase
MSQGIQEEYPAFKPFPDTQMRMLDHIDLYLEHEGTHGLGFIRGIKQVNPDEWFFKAHFYQDPVNPGSLGLEAFLQLLKYAAYKRWGLNLDTRLTTNVVGEEHSWLYRGQVIPTNKKVSVEASITHIDDTRKFMKANGYLSVDNRIIYQMTDFTIKVNEPLL